MKRSSGSPEITAAAITVVGSLLVSVILSYIEGRVGFMAVLAVLAVLLVIALIVMLYRYAGPKVTGGAFVGMLVIGFLVFLAFGRGWPKGMREARSVTATQGAATIAPTLTSQATTAPQSTATSAATATATQGQELAKEINLNFSTEPPTVDPNLATDTTSVQCDELFFLGLTDYDEKTLEVIPELATEWKVSDDGLTWTFKMRKDVEWIRYDPATKKAQKMGKVTAHDIVYSVKRTLDPATASDYAYVDYIIKNGQAVNTGESKDLDSIGVKALDDYTVEFTLEQPAGYFPGIASMWVNRPVPQKAIEAAGDKWTEPGNIWTNGPYMLESWEHEKGMVMVKNPYYFDAKNVSIEKINWVMVNEDSTAFAMYENGELDVQAPPLDDMDRIKADPQLSKELYIAPVLCTYYFGFNTTKPPFDNAKVRKAFSMAIDRQKLIDTVLKGGQLPAKSFACPGIFGSVAEDASFKGVSFDPAGAKALLAEAGFADGKGLPEITLMFNTSEGHAKIAQFVQQSIKENLGVDIKLANQEWKVYLKTVTEDAPQMYRYGWCADYPDQNNWVLEVFHPSKSLNRPKWNPQKDPSAKRFAELCDQGAAASDPNERKQLYAQAEKILVEEQSIIAPIYYYTRVVCTKPYVQRGYAPFGGEHIDKWRVLARGTDAQ